MDLGASSATCKCILWGVLSIAFKFMPISSFALMSQLSVAVLDEGIKKAQKLLRQRTNAGACQPITTVAKFGSRDGEGEQRDS